MGETKVLTRDDILAIASATTKGTLPRKKIAVATLGGDVWIRGMSGKERDRLEEGMRVKKGARRGEIDMRNFRAVRASRCLIREDGERLMTDMDADILGNLPEGVLDFINTEITSLSGMDDGEVDDLKNDSASLAVSDGSASSSLSN